MASPHVPISQKPLLRPGMPVSVYRGYTGTFGGFAATDRGDIILIFTEHQFGDSSIGDPVMLEPYGAKVGTVERVRFGIKRIAGMKGRSIPRCLKLPRNGETANINMRFRGLADDLPIVLKRPVLPELDRLCVKSGAATRVTYGTIRHLDWSLPVLLPDGTYARFADQIATEPMAKSGDSGAILFTADTFEPVGVVSSAHELGTFFSKLTNVARESSLAGIYSPISLPKNASPELRCVVSNIVPDGFFAQKCSLLGKESEQVLEELGVRTAQRSSEGGFSVTYEDMITFSGPHLPGDEGSVITSKDGHLVGLDVAGDEKRTFAIKASRVMKALNLELVKLSESGRRFLSASGYYKKFCDNCRVSLYIDTETCPFCGRRVYWGLQRIKDYQVDGK
jgi:hypothetical protein